MQTSDVQEIVAGLADELVASGTERGLQVAAQVDGRPVVDVVAGLAEPETGRPGRAGDLFYNWSIGKGATATLVHGLVDGGTLCHDLPVAELWPELARQAGDHRAAGAEPQWGGARAAGRHHARFRL